MKVLETDRLVLRRLTTEDAPFILELLNDAAFIRYIGDKGVRTLEDARNYVVNGPMASYEQFGFGLYATELKETRVPIGICGILKRETLPDPDIGFAFLSAYRNHGYAFEAAAATMKYARETLGLEQILAITSPDNEASAKLLGKIGLRFDRLTKLSAEADEVRLFTTKGDVRMPEDQFIPHLIVNDGLAALKFYKEVFGAEEGHNMMAPDGKRLLHGEVILDGHKLVISDEFTAEEGGKCKTPQTLGGTSVRITLQTDDADAIVERAVSRGAKVLMPLQDMFWGARYGQILDPFGHNWGINQQLQEQTEEETNAAAEKFFAKQ